MLHEPPWTVSTFNEAAGKADDHLLKVDVDGVVQDALAVGLIHHDQRVHLKDRRDV